MNRKLIQWMGLTGVLALLSYTAAVVFSPLAYPGYNWMAQAVSDLSAESAPSKMLWKQLAAFYDAGSVVCAVCTVISVSENRVGSGLFRTGIVLFGVMNWISATGYRMFPLADAGNEITAFQEWMHMAVTGLVVLLSVVSLVMIILAGFRKAAVRSVSIWALAALVMMMAGAVGTGIVPPEYFGIAERFSVFAAVGFNAVLGLFLFNGWKGMAE